MDLAVHVAQRAILSFAQFEREVIGERVRDKIAASKRKGLWVGGPVPLGYRCIDKKLEIVPEEASRAAFELRSGGFLSETPSEVVERAMRRLVEEMIELFSRRPIGKLFGELAGFMRDSLIKLAWLPSTDKLAYLDPLLALGAAGKITIETLNYDNAIELRAAEKSIPCKTGLTEWSSMGSLPRMASRTQRLSPRLGLQPREDAKHINRRAHSWRRTARRCDHL
jgi:hypothetical protein